MKIAIIGYGKMGRKIEEIALSKGHQISIKIDKDNKNDFDDKAFLSSDVAMEFSTPSSAFENIVKCIDLGIPVVSGSTGWLDRLEEITDLVHRKEGTLIYASNFSIGVNVLFNMNKQLSSIMNSLGTYYPSIKEIHHSEKLDAPSGTAISLAESIIDECTSIEKWISGSAGGPSSLEIESVREGKVAGTHLISWKSEIDQISLKHEAFSREGFAIGAVFAAENILDRSGLITMSDILGF